MGSDKESRVPQTEEGDTKERQSTRAETGKCCAWGNRRNKDKSERTDKKRSFNTNSNKKLYILLHVYKRILLIKLQ
jgi:hypothetical protein